MIQYLSSSPPVTMFLDALSRTPDLRAEAFRYASPRLFSPQSSRLSLYLKQLGMIKSHGSSEAVLCGLLVRNLVAESHAHSHRGSSADHAESALPAVIEASDEEESVLLLHLSDLHFGREHRWRRADSILSQHRRSLHEVLLEDLERLNLREQVAGIALAGDFAQTGQPAEFREARSFVRELQRALAVPSDRVVGVCGNHDVSFVKDADEDLALHADRSAWEFFSEVQFGSSDDHRVLTLESQSGEVVVQIAALDSCQIVSPETSGLGWTATHVLTQLAEGLRQAAEGFASTAVRALLLHHHVLPVVSCSVDQVRLGKGPSLLLNSAEILAWSLRHGISAILHGHHHQPFASELAVVNAGALSRRMLIFGAGSCGVRREHLDEFSRNHYFLHRIRRNSWSVLSRSLSDDGLSFDSHWSQVFPLDRS